MKRKLLVILIVLTLVTSMGLLVACNDTRADDLTRFDGAKFSGVGGNIYNEIVTIGTTYKDRTYGEEGEKIFADYLSSKLATYGYIDESYEFEYKDMLSKSNEVIKSKNIIFKKDNPTSKEAVLITSQIDNMYGKEGFNDEGVYAGATGVAIMMELASALKDVVLPFDVYFVGFGANSMSLEGAGDFFNHFYEHNDKKNTLLMIDLSKPIGGDHMYMYSEEVKTEHNEFLYNVAKKNKFDFRNIPLDKQAMNTILLENQPMNYTHVGLLSSNIFFVSDKIPSVNFISVNWETKTINEVIETKGLPNIAGTKNDNLETFVKRVGKDRIEKEADMVYTTIYQSIIDPSFAKVMNSSITNMPDYSVWNNPYLVFGLRIGLGVILIVLAVMISSRLKNKLPARPMEEFMKDIGATNVYGNVYMGNPYMNNNANNSNPNNKAEDPFDSDDKGSDDPFEEVKKDFDNKDKNSKDNDNNNNKNDASHDIFGM